METVCTTSYLVLVNGEPRGFVSPSRGTKQEDPLLPYLFLLCAKGLLALLRKAEENKALHGILSSSRGVRISHLLFANDSLLFYQAFVLECVNLMNLLQQYEEASGQEINRQKTSLFFSKNTHPHVKTDIQSMLGACVMTDCEKYLLENHMFVSHTKQTQRKIIGFTSFAIDNMHYVSFRIYNKKVYLGVVNFKTKNQKFSRTLSIFIPIPLTPKICGLSISYMCMF